MNVVYNHQDVAVCRYFTEDSCGFHPANFRCVSSRLVVKKVLKLDNFQPTDFDPLWTLGGDLSVAGVQFACDFLTEFEKASN